MKNKENSVCVNAGGLVKGMNSFVEYLNTLHNASARSSNAISENNVHSQFFSRLRVDRPLVAQIASYMTAQARCLIITGHAGDGKTGLQLDTLRHLGLIDDNTPISPQGRLRWHHGVVEGIFYVKDMSEIGVAERAELLWKGISSVDQKDSSIIVTNTGPLVEAFKKLHSRFDKTADEAESEILEMLLTPVGEMAGKVTVLNLALLDTVELLPHFLDNVTHPSLWSACSECELADACAIRRNATALRERRTRVLDLLRPAYEWWHENDERLTIRQMLAHIAFSVTGGASCGADAVSASDLSDNLFGFQGTNVNSTATQIAAIRKMRQLEMDCRTIEADYDIFVKRSQDQVGLLVTDSDAEDLESRARVRRHYFVYGEDQVDFYGLIGAKGLKEYRAIRRSGSTAGFSRIRVRWHDAARYALRYLFLGKHLGPSDEVLVTVRAHASGAIPRVQLAIGSFHDISINVHQVVSDGLSDGRLGIMTMSAEGVELPLPWPMLAYFLRVHDGVIEPPTDPLLRRGVETVKNRIVNEIARNPSDRVHVIAERNGRLEHRWYRWISEDEVEVN